MSVAYDGLSFDLLGHASVRIETADGVVIYVDPWSEVFDDEPKDGDVVLITHDDFDHYDPAAIAAVAGPDATVAAYEAVDTGDLDFDVVSLPHEGESTVDGLGIESIPAYNDPAGDHVDENGDPFHAEGEVIGLLVTIDGTTVYFVSDTDFLEHHESVTADVFIPPIGGHYTMDRHEAADFARSVDPEIVLPVHYDTFEAIETDVGAFVDELTADGITVETF
jgi:L-ascorbate metabolism protein UlaG (beta-lactamase superfamily)